MTTTKSSGENAINQIARSIDLLLRLKIQEVKGDRTQKEMILLLDQHGATGAEISSLLGVSATTVHPELSKARAARDGKSKAKSERRKG